MRNRGVQLPRRHEMVLQRIQGVVHCVRTSYGLKQQSGEYFHYQVTLCGYGLSGTDVEETWDTAGDWAHVIVITCMACQMRFEEAK